MTSPWYRWDGDDLILRIRAQPRASRDGLGGVHGECLRVRIAAPPAEGKANSRLLAYLAGAFGVAKRDVELVRGQSGREKTVRIRQPRQIPDELQLTLTNGN